MADIAAGPTGPELSEQMDADHDSHQQDNVQSNPPGGRRGDLVLLVLVALVAGLVVFGVFQGHTWRDGGTDADARSAVLKASRQEVIALTTISSKTSDQDIARLLDGATKGFRAEFAEQADNFRSALTSGDVSSTGVVTGAGVDSLRGNKAEVLIAASGTVSNKQSKAPQPRNYRLRLGMEKVDGRWLVASLEFVS